MTNAEYLKRIFNEYNQKLISDDEFDRILGNYLAFTTKDSRWIHPNDRLFWSEQYSHLREVRDRVETEMSIISEMLYGKIVKD